MYVVFAFTYDLPGIFNPVVIFPGKRIPKETGFNIERFQFTDLNFNGPYCNVYLKGNHAKTGRIDPFPNLFLKNTKPPIVPRCPRLFF